MKSPILLAVGVFILFFGIQGFYINKYTFHFEKNFLAAHSTEAAADANKPPFTFVPTKTTSYSLMTIGGLLIVYTFAARSK